MSLVQLNNHGVEHLASGSYMEATKCFKMAMTGLQAEASKWGQENDAADDDIVSLSQDPQVVPVRFISETTLEKVQSSSPMHIFDKAFALVNDAAENWPLLTAVLLYNIGLATHLQGILQADEQALRAALKMYAVSWKCVQSYSRQDSSGFHLVALAICNNTCQIHLMMMEVSDASCYMQQLGSLLNSRTVPEEAHELVINLSLFQGMLFGAPAA